MTGNKRRKGNAVMQEGFTLEHRLPTRWIADKPAKSFLGDIKAAGREHATLIATAVPDPAISNLWQ